MACGGISMLIGTRIPPNLRFRIPRDFESPWALGEDSWDLIHLRMGYGSISSWPEMYHNVFRYVNFTHWHITCVERIITLTGHRHLRPGVGHFEQVEIDLTPRCDDGTMPTHPVPEWYHWLEDATARASRSIKYQQDTKSLLETQGFVDVRTQVIKLPLNPWPADPHLKEIGRWYNLGLIEGLEAATLGPLTRVYRWSPETVRKIVRDVKAGICNKNCHIYNNM